MELLDKILSKDNMNKAYRNVMKNKGASVALVSKYLGHSDIATTSNIYSHMFKSELQNIAEELKDL